MYRSIKRLLDIVLSLLGSVLCLPFFLVITALIKLDSPGPVLFKQQRVGRGKRLFTILKFRTMRTDAPADMPTHALSAPEHWITRTGRFLRRTSLDELPQLFNILRGDMSIVGPRPALWNQYDLIAERDRYPGRWGLTPNDVRPGLTGWAQINGRDELSVPEKARLDGFYMHLYGIEVDLRCIAITVKSVLRHEGVVEGDRGGHR